MVDAAMPEGQRVRLLCVLSIGLLLLCGCRTATPVAASAATPAVPRHDAVHWTTPRDWNEVPAGRLVRAPSVASAPKLSVDAEIGVFSKYVWRGQLLVDDPVLQPSVSLSYGGWSFTAWGNLDLTDANGDQGAFSEIDLILEHVHTLEAVDPCVRLFAGAAWYAFPASAADATAELYAGLALDVPLSPRVTLYYDVVEVDGVYVSLEAGHEVSVPGGTLELRANLGWGDNSWNQFSWGVPTEGFNDLTLLAAYTWTNGRVSVKPSVAWSALVDGDIRDAVPYDSSWILGLTFGLSL